MGYTQHLFHYSLSWMTLPKTFTSLNKFSNVQNGVSVVALLQRYIEKVYVEQFRAWHIVSSNKLEDILSVTFKTMNGWN